MINIPFATPEHAQMAARAVSVDEELQKDKCDRQVVADGSTVTATITATEARVLRVAVSSYFDMMSVAVRTLREFS